MDALSCLTLEKMGAALYLHTKLAARALRAADATDYLARKGVFEGMGISPRPEPYRKTATVSKNDTAHQMGDVVEGGCWGGAAGTVTSAAVGTPFAAITRTYQNQPVFDVEELGRLGKLMKVPAGTTLRTGKIEGIIGPTYSPRTRTIYSRYPNTVGVAHEMGHASGPRGWRFSRYPMMFMNDLGMTTMSGVIRAAHAANQRYLNEKGSKAGWGSKLLSGMDVAAKAAAGLVLADEGQATARALMALSKLRGRAGFVTGAKAMIPAFGTDLATVLGNHIVAPKVGDAIAAALTYSPKKEKA